MSWQDQANRALTMFEGSSDDHEDHILSSRGDDTSIYAVYRDFLVDA
jgi:hypothetical protein